MLITPQYDIPCDRAVGDWDYDHALKCKVPCSALAAETLNQIDRFYRRSQVTMLELGSGPAIDIKFALRSGIQSVVALDPSPSALKYALEAKEEFGSKLDFLPIRFCDYHYVPESVIWAHSNYALPYQGKVGFRELMTASTETVKVGGFFSGIFFGVHDEWNTPEHGDLPFFRKHEVEAFFEGFEIDIRERNGPGHIQGGEGQTAPDLVPKWWHTFRVIARRVEPVL